MFRYFLSLFLAVGVIWSCSESDLMTPKDAFLDKVDPGTYEVEINGTLNDYSLATYAVSDPMGSQINGTRNAVNSISISMPGQLQKGIFSQLDGVTIAIMTPQGILSNIGPSGELPLVLEITDVKNNKGLVSGNFYGQVYNLDTEEILELTNGLFKEIEFDPITSDNRILQAEFNGTLFDFSTGAQASGATTAAIISGYSSDQIKTLSIMVPGGISEGTFTEEDGVVLSVILDTSGSPDDVYTNFNAASNTFLPVTLKITQIILGDDAAPGRVKGVFSGTIAKFSGGNPQEEIEVTEGKIDVPIVID